MMDYFLSANTSLRESFKHNFVEHTFIATAYCEHCKGVVRRERGGEREGDRGGGEERVTCINFSCICMYCIMSIFIVYCNYLPFSLPSLSSSSPFLSLLVERYSASGCPV